MSAPLDINNTTGGKLTAVCTSFIVLDTIFVIGRQSSRRIKKTPWGLDDFCMIPAYISCIGMCALGYVMIEKANVGYHLDAALYRDPQTVLHWWKCIYALCLIYLTACALPKLSILFLYRRIFTDKWTHIITWILIMTVILNWVCYGLACIFQCIPIQGAWDKTIKAKCVSIPLLWKLSNVPILVTDLPMLFLPFPSLWKLQTSNAKKLGLTFIFICGALGVTASLIRFALFEKPFAFTDITRASVAAVSWSIIEPSMYLIASCLLSMKPVVIHLVGKSSRARSYMDRVLHGEKTPQPSSGPLPLDTFSGNRGKVRGSAVAAVVARSDGFATLHDSSVSEEELLARQGTSATVPNAEIGVGMRKDVWVVEGPR